MTTNFKKLKRKDTLGENPICHLSNPRPGGDLLAVWVRILLLPLALLFALLKGF